MQDDVELWTERQATEYLKVRWTGRDATRSALKAGVAGPSLRVRSAVLYRADEVRAAVERGADVLAPRSEQLDAARAWWHLGDRLYVLVRAVARAKGVPFVATCGGIVVLGAEITGIDGVLEPEGVALSEARRDDASPRRPYTRLATAFELADPGPWFEGQLGRRWRTGAGGPFTIVHWGARGTMGS